MSKCPPHLKPFYCKVSSRVSRTTQTFGSHPHQLIAPLWLRGRCRKFCRNKKKKKRKQQHLIVKSNMQLRNFYPADMNCNNLCGTKQMVPALERWDHLHQKTKTPQNSFQKTGPRLLSFTPSEDALSHTHLPDKLWTLPVLLRCKRRRNCISADRVRHFTVLPHASFWRCPLSFLLLSSILWSQQNTAQHCGFFVCVFKPVTHCCHMCRLAITTG